MIYIYIVGILFECLITDEKKIPYFRLETKGVNENGLNRKENNCEDISIIIYIVALFWIKA
jgi:hypothetical protein